MKEGASSFFAGLLGGAVVGAVAYFFISAGTKKAVRSEIETGSVDIEREIRKQVDRQVRPAVDEEIRLVLSGYGITPQLMRSVTGAANRLLG